MYEVKLRPSHPTGVYHRAGREFNKTEPVKMHTVPKAIADDTNLIVKEVEPEVPQGRGQEKGKEAGGKGEK